MTAAWSVVLRQPETNRWRELSFYAFLLKHCEALAATRLPLGDALERFPDESGKFFRIGEELCVLEWDLTGCLFEFKGGYKLDYGPDNLSLKKFSIVYHTDNFNLRVHKLNEDVEALLALLGGGDPKRRPRKGEPSRREFVETSLDRDSRHSILELVRRFRECPLIKAAVEARNAFVHSYRDEPDREWRWSMLVPATRIREYQSGSDPFAEALRRIVDPPHVDAYADAQADRLFETLQEVQQFRDDLYGALLADLAALVARQSEETQLRFKWVLDHDELWRDLLKEASRARAAHGDDGANPDRTREGGGES